MSQGILQLAGGSIPGRDHLGRGEVLLGRNNQDACYWERSRELLVAVVTDGCGSAPYSEVGARLGARLLAKSVELAYRRLSAQAGEEVLVLQDSFWEEVRRDMLSKLRMLTLQLARSPEDFPKVLADYFLFALVGALITPSRCVVFSLGDGLWALNGNVQRIGPFPENRPPYLAYGLVSSSFSETPELLKFRIEQSLPTDELQTLLIGTDGVADLLNLGDRNIPGKEEKAGPLSQFWENDLYFRNPDAIRRRLSLLNREVRRLNPQTGRMECESGLLRDDTTLVVIRSPLRVSRPETAG